MNQRVLNLGAFALEHRIAHGGMGEIWRGFHQGSGTPIAVKVLTGDYLRQQAYHEDFKREVQAVAGLHHPHVIMVHDYGALPASVEAFTSGELVGGSPYLIMELASRGSLDRIRLPLRWVDFSRIVRGLLSALAHAHSHGIIHRDIKPGNVLLGSTDDPRPSLKLTDFGIAHSIDRHRPSHADASIHGTVEDVLGTPWYMAPEQLTGHWRDYGPWTDLYALGIVAWELATGDVPFDGESPFDIGMAHLEKRLPTFEPRMQAPAGLTEWLHGLLEKEHRDRFQTAADALAAFDALGEPADVERGTGPQFRQALPCVPSLFSANDTAADATRPEPAELDGALDGTTLIQRAAGRPVSKPTARLAFDAIAEPPHDWRTLENPNADATFDGAGLGLVGLRQIPFVGRDNERDILWGCMHHVRRAQRPRVVALRGGAGLGKSRLAEWLARRSVESGASVVLTVRHDEASGARSGFARTFAEHFRLIGLAPSEARARLRTLLAQLGSFDPLFVDEVTDLLADAMEPPDEGTRQAFSGRASDRHRLFVRLLQLVGRRRSVIVVVDDVQWSADTLATVDRILKDGPIDQIGALVVMTLRDEELAQQPQAAALFQALLTHEEVIDLPIRRLSDADTARLLDKLLLLRGGLRDEIVQRIDGNPLFAVQLITDWIEHQRLDARSGGFDLVDDAGISIPDDLYVVWADRLELLLHSDRDRRAVELAATLGREFTTPELSAACEASEFVLPVDLVARLVNSRLCLATEHGWTFAHAMLREAVRRRCAESGVWAARNSACADILEAGSASADISERRARHLVEAERWGDAVDALFDAARAVNRRGEPARAHDLVTLRERALASAGVQASDPRFGAGWALEANILLRLQQEPEAERLAQRVLQEGERGEWAAAAADAHDVLAFLNRRDGALSTARDHSVRALALYDKCGNVDGALRARLNLGYTDLAEHRASDALAQFERVRTGFEQLEDAAGIARAEMAAGRAWLVVGNAEAATAALERAQAGFESEGLVALARECQVVREIGAKRSAA
jgi:eukaryotic-like serine/threonine-protein kinase